jgi:hypothetical protein
MLRGDPDRSYQAALPLDKMVYQALHTHHVYIQRESARKREEERE